MVAGITAGPRDASGIPADAEASFSMVEVLRHLRQWLGGHGCDPRTRTVLQASQLSPLMGVDLHYDTVEVRVRAPFGDLYLDPPR